VVDEHSTALSLEIPLLLKWRTGLATHPRYLGRVRKPIQQSDPAVDATLRPKTKKATKPGQEKPARTIPLLHANASAGGDLAAPALTVNLGQTTCPPCLFLVSSLRPASV
jgi:hypothetical protein